VTVEGQKGESGAEELNCAFEKWGNVRTLINAVLVDSTATGVAYLANWTILWDSNKGQAHTEDTNERNERKIIVNFKFDREQKTRALRDIEIRTTGELRRYDIMKIIAKLAKQYEKY
jgi:hypothetical protein